MNFVSISLTQDQSQAHRKARSSKAKGFPRLFLPHLGKSAEVAVEQILHPQWRSSLFELYLEVDIYQKRKKLEVACCRSLRK